MPCPEGTIPLDYGNTLFPQCKANTCSSPDSYIDLTSTAAYNCISSQTCLGRSQGNRFPTHIEEYGQWSYDKCVGGEVEIPFDYQSKFYFLHRRSTYYNIDCTFDQPCGQLTNDSLAYTEINKSEAQLVLLLSNFEINAPIVIEAQSSRQRLIASYPFGGSRQFQVSVGASCLFYVIKGRLVFKLIAFVVSEHYWTVSDYIVVAQNWNSQVDLIYCRYQMTSPGTISGQGLANSLNGGTLNIVKLQILDQVNMTKFPIVNLGKSAGVVTISDSYISMVNRSAGPGAAVQCELYSHSSSIQILINTTFYDCVSRYVFDYGGYQTGYDVGAVYIYIHEGAYHRFDLRGCRYQVGDETCIGKGLFIEVGNMIELMRRSDKLANYGEIEPDTQKNE
ncbi:MAG: hypothetical protein EZS28_047019, partial [Streblomastix strix]